MSPPRTSTAETLGIDDAALRAERIAAMLARWEAEDTTDEPDWDIADIEPLALGPAPAPGAGKEP